LTYQKYIPKALQLNSKNATLATLCKFNK